MNYYERHIGDYIKDTAHLSLLEHGVYGRLLDVYYIREGGIPVAQVERLAGVRSKDERAALTAVLDEFFAIQDEHFTHKRCDMEIERCHEKKRKAQASANTRWSHTERNANASPNAMRTHSEGNALQSPVTSNQTPKVKSARGSRLPTDWVPDAQDLAYAANSGLMPSQVASETEKFRDWWSAAPGQKGVKADWPATWRTWVRKASESPSKDLGDSRFAGGI